MKYIIDTEAKKLSWDGKTIDLYSDEAFQLLSKQWLKIGWNQNYIYTFSWMGRPIIQLPEDMIRYQETVFAVKPDVIVETGIAHGGSLIYSASLCKTLGKGRVIGVDIEIRPHNRKAIEEHPLFPYITLIEGSATAPDVVEGVKSLIKPGETVLVALDSDHSKKHVLEELKAYAPLVTPGSYIIATDGIMQDLTDVPRGKEEWSWDNPQTAALEYLKEHPEFVLEQPNRIFNESSLTENITHWPSAWLKRK